MKVHAPYTSWIFAQIEASEHSSTPRVLHRSGQLEVLYTGGMNREIF
jgi:hypothetical protein